VHSTRPIGTTLAIIALVVFSATAAFAAYTNGAPIHANFRHTPVNGADKPAGVRMDGKWVYTSSATIADIDGNLGNGREVVVGTADGYVNAFSATGAKLWSYRVASCSYRGFNSGDDLIQGSPAVGDLDGDGTPEVVVGYGTRTALSEITCDGNDTGGVVAINGANGSLRWRYKTVPDNMNNFALNGTIASPALADTDGDGKLEVGFGSINNNVFLLSSSGTLLWKYRTFDTVFSTPAFADVNGDGRREMLIGTDFGPNNCVPNTPGCRIPGTYGFLYAFNTAGGPNQTREFGTGYLWRAAFDTVVNSSPVVADLEGDGSLEVVIGSGNESRDGGSARGRAVRILDAATGATKRTLPMPAQVPSTPALADLDGNGSLDIVAAAGSWVVAWRPDGSKLWEVEPTSPEDGSKTEFVTYSNAPVVADLDGNGSLEVAIIAKKAVAVLRGDNGQQLTASSGAAGDTRPVLWMWLFNASTPAIGDLDNNGTLELAAGGTNIHTDYNFPASGPGFMYAWGDFASWLGSPPAAGRTPYATPWPMAHGGPSHIGVLASAIQAPATLSSFLKVGTSQTFEVSVRANNGDIINWSAAESDPSGLVSVTPGSGSSERLRLRLTAPNTPGEYSATVTLSAPGLPNKVITLAVTATAADVSQTGLPLVGK
jgi:hypothetical protein